MCNIERVAVVCALEEEISHIASELNDVTHKNFASLDVSQGQLEDYKCQ